MVLIVKRAAGIITGTGAGHWDTMVDFLGSGQGGTGIRFNDEGDATIRFLRTDSGDMNMWMSNAQREFSIVGYDTGVAGVLGPNLRLIGDTLTSVPALALYQTNAALGDTHLGSFLGDDSNVNIYAFPATYSLAFLTWDTSGDAVGVKLWIGPGDAATIQWWSNQWIKVYDDEGVTETWALNGVSGEQFVTGDILDADVATNSVGSTTNEFLNVYITTDGRYFMAADQAEWMKSTGSDIRWGVGAADELFLSVTSLGPVTSEGLDLGGTANEYLNAYFGDNGGVFFGLTQDAFLNWTNGANTFDISTADGVGGFSVRLEFGSGAGAGLSTITVREPLIMAANIDLGPREVSRTLTADTLGVGVTTFAAVGELMEITGDAGANVVATITGGTTGQILMLVFVDGFVTITDDDTHGADSVDLSAAFVSADDTTLVIFYDGTSWYELSRSVN